MRPLKFGGQLRGDELLALGRKAIGLSRQLSRLAIAARRGFGYLDDVPGIEAKGGE